MSFVEKRNEFRPQSGEAPFELHEVFFSRTDTRGIIQAGNYIFRRVADYAWEEMVGAPHKLIRHPDMPKAVFWMLWNTIQRGEAMGAYVKNLAKDGLYYWVFAVVIPVEGGYLSTRIKPSSPLLETVVGLYETALAAERDDGLTPEASAQALQNSIQALGFDDYLHFSTHALSQELNAREQSLKGIPDRTIHRARELLDYAAKLERETHALIGDFNTMRTIPHNMRVIASRLEPTGGPVSTLSQNYGAMSQEISDWFEQHVDGEDSTFSTIKSSANMVVFMRCMAKILTETVTQLDSERRGLGTIDLPSERQILNRVKSDYDAETRKRSQQVAEEAKKILAACRVMHRQVLGLSTTRVMCKIEGARVANQGESLHDIIIQLETFQTRIKARLDEIAHIAERILAG